MTDLRTAAQQALDAILDWRMTGGRNTKRLMPAYYSLRAALQRKPLTREQAIALWADKSDGPSNGEIVSFARAIERAHGIKE